MKTYYYIILSILAASVAQANVVISGTALQGATGVVDGETGYLIVATDGDSFGGLSISHGADLTASASFGGGDFTVIGSNVAFTSFGSVRMGTAFDFALTGGLTANDAFAYVVFDSSSDTAIGGDSFSIFTTGDWELPSDGFTITANSEYSQITGGPSFTGTITAVPEPSAYAALSGLLALSWVMVRRRRA